MMGAYIRNYTVVCIVVEVLYIPGRSISLLEGQDVVGSSMQCSKGALIGAVPSMCIRTGVSHWSGKNDISWVHGYSNSKVISWVHGQQQ